MPHRRWISAICAIAIVVTTFPLAAFLTAKPAKAAWYNDDWHYRKNILFTHSGAESNVYLNLSGANALDTSASGKFQADCGDLRFTDGNGNVLPYFLVSGCGTLTTVVHVLYGSMPAGDQYLYVYYGNPTIANGTTNFDFSTAATGITFGSVGAEESSQGPVTEWKLDEGYGTSTKDSSTNGNNGTLTNTPTWQSPDMCVSGKCLLFDGATSYVNTPYSASLYPGTVTAGAWIFPTKGQTGNIISAGSNNGWRFRMNGSQTITFFDRGATNQLTSTSTVPLNQWSFVTIVGDGSGLKIYLNGRLDKSNAVSFGGANPAGNTVVLGTYASTSVTESFAGRIDDASIYSYARSQSQIRQDYTAGLASMNAQQGNLGNGLVGYWKMDDNVSGNAQTLKDSSGSTNNATTFNGPNATGMDCTVAAKFGGGCSFDGVDDYATTPLINLGNTYTISTWVKTTSSTTSLIFSNYNSSVGFNEAMQLSSKAIISPKDTNNIQQSATSTTSINDGNWHLVTGTVDWNRMVTKIYVDGRFEASTTLTGSPKTGDSTASYIAARASNGVPTINFYAGLLDDLRTYTRALSGSEVQQLYNFGPPPVAAYNFEEPAGGSANDISGNGLTMGIVGTPPARVLGAHGLAARIVAGTNYMSTGAATIANPTRFTMSAWVKPNNVMTGGVMGFGTDNILQIQSDGSLYLRVRKSDGTYPGGTTTATNVYTAADIGHYMHVAVTFDGSTATFYKNGTLVGQTSYSMAAYNESVPLQIGYMGTSYFNGGVDDAYFFNYPLSPHQMTQLYSQGSNIADYPVGWWKMDEGQGTVANNSGVGGSTLGGTLTNMSSPPTATSGWSSNGKYGSALNFDGIDDYVGIGSPTALQFSSSFSISAWVNLSTISRYNEILAKSDSTATSRAYELRTQATTGVPYFVVYAGGSCTGYAAAGPKAVPTGSWHYISGTYDGQTGKLAVYMDGVLVGSGSATGTICGSNGNASIGRLGDYSTDSGSNTTGLIDEVKVWDATLSTQDVLADYNRAGGQRAGSASTENVTTKSGATGTQPSNSKNSEYCVPGDTSSCAAPTAEWKFEEGSGTAAKDSSGGGDDGTWSGSGNHWAPGKIGTAANFNGANDVITTGHNSGVVVSTGSFSLETWFKTPAMPSNAVWLIDTKFCGSNGAGYYLSLQSPYIVGAIANGTSQFALSVTATSYADNKWHHVAFVVQRGSPDTYFMYIDGQLAKSQTFSSTGWDLSSGNSLTIGAGNCGGSYFTGSMDQVRLYQYARTPAQVAWDFNKGAPVAWYKLDECSGSTVHSSTNPYNAALNGTITVGGTGTQTTVGTCQTSGTAWGAGAGGKRGASLNFDGTDDFANLSNNTIFNANGSYITTSAWVKPVSTGVSKVFLSKGGGGSGGWAIWYYNNNTVLTWFKKGSSQVVIRSTNKTYAAGQWIHVAVVMRMDTVTLANNDIQIYVNGKLDEGALTATDVPTAPIASLKIGARATTDGTESDFYSGQVDDVQIFNYALTSTQIATLYNGGSVYWGQ